MRYAYAVPPFVVFWLIGITMVAWPGDQVHGYLLHAVQVPWPHPYPWPCDATIAGIQSIQVLLGSAVIRPWLHRICWRRARAGFLLALVLVLSFGVTLMHAPPFIVWHWIWLVGGSVALLVLLCIERATHVSIREGDAQFSS